MKTAFHRWIYNQSIRKKLIFSSILGTILAFIPIFTIICIYEFYTLRNHSLDVIRVQAELLSESAAVPLAFNDTRTASETLAALRGDKDIVEAVLFLSDGSIFVHYNRFRTQVEKWREKLPLSTYREYLTLSEVVIVRPIRLRSDLVGSLLLVKSLHSFYNRLVWYALITVTAFIIGFSIAVIFAAKVGKMISDPLTALTSATQKILKDGDYATPITTTLNDEVGSLSRAFNDMMSQLRERDLTLRQLAYYDRVTGIPNRHYFEERIEQSITNARRYGSSCYLLIIDLDDFKNVNDTYGHPVGDLLLHHIGKQLENTLRKNDDFFRLGGDEFAVIVESASAHEFVEFIADKIIRALSAPVQFQKFRIQIGASIGISAFPHYSTDTDSLMRTADTAMYMAKALGKNCYCYFRP